MYFVENHMIAKHQCCTVGGNIFYFFQIIKCHFNSDLFTIT